jgi:release factor glutamine methyltransferase
MKHNPTISKLLEQGRFYLASAGIASSWLDAELLLAYCLKKDRARLYVDWHHNITAEEEILFGTLLARRAHREPLAYIVGHKEFWSMNLQVDRHVLIPRPETEILVQEAAALLRQDGRTRGRLRVFDFGTGSGAVALALARELPSAFIIGSDVSREALKIARTNANRCGLHEQVIFVCGDALCAFRRAACFDLVVSNPPYIPSTDIESLDPEIREHEPRQAIDGGPDGLAYYRRLIPAVGDILKDRGWLALEIGAGQAAAVTELLQSCHGYTNIGIVKDYGRIERVIRAQWR